MIFKSKDELRDWVFKTAAGLKRPTLVLLNGNLGAGKTQAVRWFAEALGARDAASPTFAIHLEYETPGGTIDHVDLYRVTSDDDLETSGFWDLFQNPQGLVFVEWADRLPDDVWPKTWSKLSLNLTKLENEDRLLEIKRL